MCRIIILKLAFLLVSTSLSYAQTKYWIDFENQKYIDQLVEPVSPIICSEWIKACSYELNNEQLESLANSGLNVLPVLSFEKTSIDKSPTLGFALEQVEAKAFLKLGLTGKGVKIGIIDGGFLKANEEENFIHLFKNNLVKAYKDYVTPELEPYGGNRMLDDDHGTEVWNLIGGKNMEKNILFGLATGSEYYLARTDHGGYEKRIEEDYFIAALEWMHDQGVRLVNASLGYNLGFTDSSENYKVYQMDGKSTSIAKAVDIAVKEKGMLIVVAAGNEGTIPSWRILSTPGDAQYAFTVGSTKLKVWDKMNFSSIGPDFIDYVKPDISIFSTSGTSYSTPVATGMIACLWELQPELTNLEVMDIVREAGHLYPYPNNYIGYGVPTCTRILKALNNEETPEPVTISTSKDALKYKFPDKEKFIIAVHKKDSTRVLNRVVYRPLGKKVKIQKVEGAVQTTLLIDDYFVEIFWKE